MSEIATYDEHGRKVQAMFSDIAHGYDRANRIMSVGTDVRWRRRAVASLLPRERGTGAGATILDLCAGTLDSTLEIHRQYPEASLIGGDFSAGMLDAGMRRIQAHSLRGGQPEALARISPQRMDAHALPLEDESLDAIFCAFGIRNLSDLRVAGEQQLRCLKPGGQLVVLEFFRPSRVATRAFHAVYNHTVLPTVGWACTGNLGAYLYLPRSIGRMCTVDEYLVQLRELGFVDASAEPLTFGVACIVRARKPTDFHTQAPGLTGSAG